MEMILLVGAFAVVVITQKVIQAKKTGCTAKKVIVDHRSYESIVAENRRKYSSRYNSSRLQAAENQKEVVQNEALSTANRTNNLIQKMITKIQSELGEEQFKTKRTTVGNINEDPHWEENTQKKMLSNCTIYEMPKATIHDNNSRNTNQFNQGCGHFCRLVFFRTSPFFKLTECLSVHHLL
jgi:hypothetical protein